MKKHHSSRDYIHQSFPIRHGPTRRLIFYLIFFFLSLCFALAAIVGFRQSRWDGQTRLNLISLSPAALLSFSPRDNTTTVISLPRGFALYLTYGYGLYRFDKVFPLDRQEKRNGLLLLSSLESTFALPFSGWLDQGSSTVSPVPTLRTLLTGHLRSNLPFFDLLRFIWSARSNVQAVDFSTGGLIKARTNLDSSVDLVLNTDRWDKYVRTNLYDPAVDSEKLTVTVVNTTNHQGLGSAVARPIENLGATVVRLTTADQTQGPCTVVGDKKLFPTHTVAALVHLFSCQFIQSETLGQRSDLIVNIGSLYWNRQTQSN